HRVVIFINAPPAPIPHVGTQVVIEAVEILTDNRLVIHGFASLNGGPAAGTAVITTDQSNKLFEVALDPPGGLVPAGGFDFVLRPIAGNAGFIQGETLTVTVAGSGFATTLIDLTPDAVVVPAVTAPDVITALETVISNVTPAPAAPAPAAPAPAAPAPVDPAPVDPGVVVATFTGTTDNLPELSTVGVNSSSPDRPRFDFVVTDVDRTLFTGTGDSFGDTGTGLGEAIDLIGVATPPGQIGVGDEVAVNRFSITFTDANSNDIRTFGADNAQIVAQEILAADGVTVTGARQDVAWVLFSIRDQGGATDVSNPNLVPGASTAEMRLADQDGLGFTVIGTWNLTGDATVNFAQDVIITATQ
ncbi:MAG TPA: hypothetical protein EYG03_12170, partial [Planctomycetes bacterium]|nr:hypothetical protein [Planctomycetota bacterium]